MTDAPKLPGEKSSTYADRVGTKASRKLKAKRHPKPGVWSGLGMMGMVGWSVAVPTLMGAALGLWLDKDQPGQHRWTLALMVAGLLLGCAIAWHWVAKEHKEIESEQEEQDD